MIPESRRRELAEDALNNLRPLPSDAAATAGLEAAVCFGEFVTGVGAIVNEPLTTRAVFTHGRFISRQVTLDFVVHRDTSDGQRVEKALVQTLATLAAIAFDQGLNFQQEQAPEGEVPAIQTERGGTIA